jgi:GTP-binding protein HflX
VRLPFLLGQSRLEPDVREALLALRELDLPAEGACPEALGRRLAELVHRAGREVGVLVSRHGTVVHALVGRRSPDVAHSLAMRNRRGLCGLRLVLAYNRPQAPPTEEDLAFLEAARLDLLVTLGHRKGVVTEAWVALPDPGGPQVEGPLEPEAIAELPVLDRIRSAEVVARRAERSLPPKRPERAILVGVRIPGSEGWSTDETLAELRRLAETAGAEVVDVLTQTRERPDPATLIGRGKVAELRSLVEAESADLVVFDEELTPAQQRTLEEALGVKVLDRTALVLDIFARRARTKEGALQVELAQLLYLLPRLGGKGVLLSRLGGGIGTRGPGETKLEMDRRRIRRRITELQHRIEEIAQVRRTQRSSRTSAGIPVVAIVGYTNAGKSTLLNALTHAGVFVEDKLFATLDPTARRIRLPSGRTAVLVDTVGFIQKLPLQLVAAFRATLEEVTEADVLVHVLDISHPNWPAQRRAVEQVLEELGAGRKPTVLALNKVDRLPATEVSQIAAKTGGVPISALRGLGLVNLLHRIEDAIPDPVRRARVAVPYEKVGLLRAVYEQGRVLERHDGPDGVHVELEAPEGVVRWLEQALNAADVTTPPPSPR